MKKYNLKNNFLFTQSEGKKQIRGEKKNVEKN